MTSALTMWMARGLHKQHEWKFELPKNESNPESHKSHLTYPPVSAIIQGIIETPTQASETRP